MRARKHLGIGLCVLGTIASASCGDDGASGSGDTIKIGVLSPLSGSLAGWGEVMDDSARFAAHEINEAGGLQGRKIELIVRDTSDDPAVAVKSARELVEAGVVAIVGPGTSSAAIPVVEQVTRSANVAMISPGATSTTLTTMDDGNTFFRNVASDALQGELLAKRVFKDGARTVGIIARDDAYGGGLADVLSESFTALGGTVQERVMYPDSKARGFSAEVEQLFSKGVPDAVVMIAFHEDGANITIDIAAEKLAKLPKMYGTDGIWSDEFASAGAPSVVDGLVGTAASVAPAADPSFVSAGKAFTALTGKPFGSDFDGGTYDCVYLVALALAQAGEISAQAVLENLNEVSRPDGNDAVRVDVQKWKDALSKVEAGADIDYRGASGDIDLDDEGDTTRGTFLFFAVEVNGTKGEIVEDEVVAFP